MSRLQADNDVLAGGAPRIPFIVKNLYGITALSSLLTFPLLYFTYHILQLVCRLMHSLWPSFVSKDPPLHLAVLSAGMLAISLAWFPGTSMASKYIVRLVRYHLDHGRSDLAEKALLVFSNQLWYRDVKNNPWLVDFLLEQRLEEERGRYLRFVTRLRRICTARRK